MDDDDSAVNAQALSKYTVRIVGHIPLYRFVREDEGQEFQIFRDPFTDEMSICFGIGDMDVTAAQAVAGYAESLVDEDEQPPITG